MSTLVRSRQAIAVALGFGALFISACQADVDVEVVVNEDGSGIVEATTTLDAEASEALLDLDTGADGLPLGDLPQSGWDVGRPETRPDGSTVITASKEFGTTVQFSEVMAELTGDDGVLRNFRLFRTKTFARVDYRIVGTIDTTGGLDAFSDTDLERALGRPVSEIAERYGATEDDVAFRLGVELPGELQGEAPAEAMEADANEPTATWSASMGDSETMTVELESATREVSALVLRGVAVVLAVLAAIAVFAQLLRIILPDRRRRPNRRPPTARSGPLKSPAASPTAGDRQSSESEPAADESATAASSEAAEAERYRVVALDGLGVLYRKDDEAPRALISFARERASTVTDEEIEAKARLLELGRITTGTFWESIGVAGNAETLDVDYLAQLQLAPGVVKYLRSLRERSVRAACFTNEAAEWAARLKASHNIEGLVDPWVISGVVGVRKPDRSIFEVLRRTTGMAPGSIQVVDDDLDILDAARELGFGTAWFSAEGEKELARGHDLIRSFDVAEERTEAEAPTAT